MSENKQTGKKEELRQPMKLDDEEEVALAKHYKELDPELTLGDAQGNRRYGSETKWFNE